MIYLATPYFDKNPVVMENRYLVNLAFAAEYLSKGLILYSLIVHCHEMAKRFSMPRDFKFWRHYNLSMLSLANELWLLKLHGWDKSVGIAAELEFAKANNIIIQEIDNVYG